MEGVTSATGVSGGGSVSNAAWEAVSKIRKEKTETTDNFCFPSYNGKDVAGIVNTYDYYAGPDKNEKYNTDEFAKAVFSLGANSKSDLEFVQGFDKLTKKYFEFVGKNPPQLGEQALTDLMDQVKTRALESGDYVGAPPPPPSPHSRFPPSMEEDSDRDWHSRGYHIRE